MDRGLLIVVGALLTLALVTGILSFVKAGQARRLRDRIATAGSIRETELVATGLPSIRLKSRESLPLVDRILKFLRFNPDMPQEQIIPWPVVVVVGVLVGVIAGFFINRLTNMSFAIPAGAITAFFTIRLIFTWQHNRYVDQIFLQIPDAIGQMVRAIRAGLPVAEAFRGVATELASPLRDEFGRLLGDVAIGRPIDQAMMRLYWRTGLTEFSFLAVTLGMQSQTGGNLAETLENIADIVRKRVAMAKRAKALAAEARMQAGILMVLPFIATLAMSQIQPFYVDQMFFNPKGQRMALVGLGFSLMGFLIIRWMIKKAGSD
ncbi:type II secretion system F family protein [Roseomonas sp. HF4]|uniref:type II secretion system F family protein n=1 Tax=Roseomonas sp. HF4 TaxID=2562313 RepID=UPI0010BF70FB|nr:type II secretion system F family protein [Roseomonas sp. HF4]